LLTLGKQSSVEQLDSSYSQQSNRGQVHFLHWTIFITWVWSQIIVKIFS